MLPTGFNRRAAGFSLIELLATLAIAAILLASAAPSFVSMAHDSRIRSRITLLLSDVNLARLEAIKRNREVVLCRSGDGRRCSRSSRPRTDWSDGWIVYVNRDRDKRRDPGEPLLRVRPALPEGLQLHFNQWWRVTYHGDGSARNGAFVLCSTREPDHARALILFYSGRPRISDRRADGGPLQCA